MMNGQRPALIGGDFNAPAGDAIFRLLSAAGFTDAIGCGRFRLAEYLSKSGTDAADRPLVGQCAAGAACGGGW